MASWWKRAPAVIGAETLHAAIVDVARAPALFSELGFSDTVEGRFEALALHMVLLQRRLLELGTAARPLAQALTDRFFASIDDAMRQIGIGDTSVPKKMKVYAEAFFGRAAAYDEGLRRDDDALSGALARNALGLGESGAGDPRARALARYVRALAAALSALGLADLERIDGAALGALAGPALTAAASEEIRA